MSYVLLKFPNVGLSMYVRTYATTESNGKSVSIWPIMTANKLIVAGYKNKGSNII